MVTGYSKIRYSVSTRAQQHIRDYFLNGRCCRWHDIVPELYSLHGDSLIRACWNRHKISSPTTDTSNRSARQYGPSSSAHCAVAWDFFRAFPLDPTQSWQTSMSPRKWLNAIFPRVEYADSRTPKAHWALCFFLVLGHLACPMPLDSEVENLWIFLGYIFYPLEHMFLAKASNILDTA